MKIQANASGTRQISITQEHIQTIRQYRLFQNLIDSNGIIDEAVLEKLKLNVRALLENGGNSDRGLLSLCFDVVYHSDMKAFGLNNLLTLYNENVNENVNENEEENNDF